MKFNYRRYINSIATIQDTIYYGVATPKDANLNPLPLSFGKNNVAVITFAPFYLDSGCTGNEVVMLDLSESGKEFYLSILTV